MVLGMSYPVIGYRTPEAVKANIRERRAAQAIALMLRAIGYRLAKRPPKRHRANASPRKATGALAYQCWRLTCLERDGWACVDCGSFAQHVHHRLPVSKHPDLILDPDNGEAVCYRHHRSRHPELPSVLFYSGVVEATDQAVTCSGIRAQNLITVANPPALCLVDLESLIHRPCRAVISAPRCLS